MLKNISWTKNEFKIGDESKYLISGDIHYFRVPHEEWRNRLELFKESGGNCVGTYIPWAIHEPNEGEFHFGDSPEYDIEEFIKISINQVEHDLNRLNGISLFLHIRATLVYRVKKRKYKENG